MVQRPSIHGLGFMLMSYLKWIIFYFLKFNIYFMSYFPQLNGNQVFMLNRAIRINWAQSSTLSSYKQMSNNLILSSSINISFSVIEVSFNYAHNVLYVPQKIKIFKNRKHSLNSIYLSIHAYVYITTIPSSSYFKCEHWSKVTTLKTFPCYLRYISIKSFSPSIVSIFKWYIIV